MPVRFATEDDLPALDEIDALAWTAETTPAPTPISFSREQDLADVVVCELAGRVVGYASLRQELAIPAHAHVGTVNGLAVHPAARGRGLGALLVQRLVEHARDRGFERLTLRVLGPNAGARRLYAACGFEVEGILCGEFRLAGREVDDVLMARRL